MNIYIYIYIYPMHVYTCMHIYIYIGTALSTAEVHRDARHGLHALRAHLRCTDISSTPAVVQYRMHAGAHCESFKIDTKFPEAQGSAP